MKNRKITILEAISKSSVKIYYSLKSLEKITSLSTRSLKYRMKLIKKKYEGKEFYLSKKGKQWNIHYTLINEFLPKYKGKRENIYVENWITEFSWNFKFNYSIDYHKKLIDLVKDELKQFKIGYCLEKDKRGYYHIHGMTNATRDIVLEKVISVLNRYLSNNEFILNVDEIRNKYCYVEYMKKSGKINLV